MTETPGVSPSFAEVYRPANHAELVAVRHVLDGMKVRYYVKNEYATLGSPSAIGSDELIVMVEAAEAPESASRIRAGLRGDEHPEESV